MKISDIIQRLEAAKAQYGDLEVFCGRAGYINPTMEQPTLENIEVCEQGDQTFSTSSQLFGRRRKKRRAIIIR